MDPFRDAVAIVTGGGSGIGRAFGSALARRGASVVLADVDGARADIVSKEIGDRSSGAQLDVRDADAVRAVVEDVAARFGRVDYLFNNAGIGVGGELTDLTHEHWDRIIDVNVRGVVNGVMAAYPLMVKQRRGHIVNTASMAGLIPPGLLTPYATTKFAVVGLSLALRQEAAGRGVRVSVVCPGPVVTPMLDAEGPDDLPTPESASTARLFLMKRTRPCSPEYLARKVMTAVARNKPIIVEPWWIRPAWALWRISPGLLLRMSERELLHARQETARP